MLGKALTTAAAGSAAGGAAGALGIEDVFSTWLYTGTGASQTITNGINLGDAVATYLTGKTITNIGSTIDAGTLSAVNDGVVPTSNTGYCYTSGSLDIYVDMGSATIVTGYLIAPQGSAPSSIFNTIEGFHVKASNDASTWTTIATFSGNGTTYPAWQPGVLRPFTFSNTTGYRYWRLDSTDASNDSLTEWALLVDSSGNGEGGLVWIKRRDFSSDHWLFDTQRGATKFLVSNDTPGQDTASTTLTSFNSDGFTLGSSSLTNQSSTPYASWTFRKAPGFFDVVTWTGNAADVDASRTISHSLGSVPGTIIVKRTDGAADWQVYHRSLGATKYLNLNQTNAEGTSVYRWRDTAPTSSVFTVGYTNNAPGNTYVAYVFAHDEAVFGENADQSVIKCGSYVGSTAGTTVNLGWEPQWILVKNISSAENWRLHDTMRGMSSNDSATAGSLIYPSLSFAETDSRCPRPTSTGFISESNQSSSHTFIYIAIRRGPMKTPTDATKVFATVEAASNGSSTTFTTNFPVDLALFRQITAAGGSFNAFDRLRGGTRYGLLTASTDAESSYSGAEFDLQTTFKETLGHGSGVNVILEAFRRAPGFFDVVAYTGDATAGKTVNHNLGVAPELIFIKQRSGTSGGVVYYGDPTKYLQLFRETYSNYQALTSSAIFNDTAPASSVFTLGAGGGVNANNATYIAYLFATVSGVSKVGSYTGTAATLNVDCGFSAGARFVLIKRTDSTGDWYVWDTARGIVSGNDPYLLLNSTAAEVTSTDYIDPYSAGFTISSSAPAAINASGGSFIFLAIA